MVESTQPQADAEEMQVDASAYEQQQSSQLMNDNEYDWSVKNPQDNGGHIAYDVKGKDAQGPWEGKRRYSDFDALYVALVRRWPGVPVPSLPPKRAIGNKDMVFVQDRTYYLQRFLRKVARYTFIVESPEFQVFARPQGGVKIEAQLTKLMPMSAVQRYERLKDKLNIDDQNLDAGQKETLNTKIVEFLAFAKKVDPLINTFKTNLAKQLTMKHHSIVGYADLGKIMERYEELNLSQYVDHVNSELVFNNPESAQLKARQGQLAGQLRNPYIDLYHWVKGESYDLAAVQQSIASRKESQQTLASLEKKKSDTQKDIDSVTAGKKTASTLFKNSSDANVMAQTLETTDKEIEAMKKLIDVQTIYIGSVVLKIFKEEKADLYKRLLQQFTVYEIQNSHQVASFWTQVLQHPKVKAQ